MTDPSESPKSSSAEYWSQLCGKARDGSVLVLSEALLRWADRHRYKLFLFLVLYYLLGFNAQWRVEPDSALYLSVGRNLAEGRGYTYNGQSHRLAFPGPPLLFAGVFKVFHADPVRHSLVAALIVMMLIGAGVLLLTYRLFLLYADRPLAVMMTFGLGISRVFYRYCFELLSDMPFLLCVMMFLVGHEAIFNRRQRAAGRIDAPARAHWYDWALLIAGLGLAIIMRPSMYALLAAIVLAMAWSLIRNPIRLPQILIGLGVAAVVAISLIWRLHLGNSADSSMGQYEEELFHVTFTHIGPMLHRLVHNYIPRMLTATLSQAVFGARLDVFTNTLVGLAVIVVSATMLCKRPLWFLWVAVTFVMMLVAIEPLDRYFLAVLPLMVFAWFSGIRWLNQRMPQPWANWLFLALFLFGGITNISHTGDFIFEQRRRPFLQYYKQGRYASDGHVAQLLQARVEEDSLVLASVRSNRILAFLSRRRVVGPLSFNEPNVREDKCYVLEPLEARERNALRAVDLGPGPPVGPRIQGKFDAKPWRLHRPVAFWVWRMFYEPRPDPPWVAREMPPSLPWIERALPASMQTLLYDPPMPSWFSGEMRRVVARAMTPGEHMPTANGTDPK